MKNIALKFRFYPTDEQVQLLAQTFGMSIKHIETTKKELVNYNIMVQMMQNINYGIFEKELDL